MFKKITSISSPVDIRQAMQEQGINHEFFLLVREQKYEEAYAIGSMYLQYHPENQSIRKFCQFIKYNREELAKMIDEEQNYTDSSEEQQDEASEEQDSDEEVEDKKSVFSAVSSVSAKSTVSSKPAKSASTVTLSLPKIQSKGVKGKQNSKVCPYHKWQHICKNQKCPNRPKN